LEAAAGAQQPVLEGQAGASGGSSASNGEEATDTATSTTHVSEEEDADAPEQGGTEAPAVSAQEEDVGEDDGAEVETVTSGSAEPSPAADTVSPSSTAPANDNQPSEELPATGTE
jgi:hypothetical protein